MMMPHFLKFDLVLDLGIQDLLRKLLSIFLGLLLFSHLLDDGFHCVDHLKEESPLLVVNECCIHRLVEKELNGELIEF